SAGCEARGGPRPRSSPPPGAARGQSTGRVPAWRSIRRRSAVPACDILGAERIREERKAERDFVGDVVHAVHHEAPAPTSTRTAPVLSASAVASGLRRCAIVPPRGGPPWWHVRA